MNLDEYAEQQADKIINLLQQRGALLSHHEVIDDLIVAVKEAVRDQRYGDIVAINVLEYEGDSLRHKDTFDEAMNRAVRAVINAEPEAQTERDSNAL